MNKRLPQESLQQYHNRLRIQQKAIKLYLRGRRVGEPVRDETTNILLDILRQELDDLKIGHN